MKRSKLCDAAAALATLCLLFPSLATGDSAQVLPKGVSHIGLQYKNYIPVDTRWGPDGSSEKVSKDLDKVLLDSTIVPLISLLEAAYSMTPGTGNVGTTMVDYEFEETEGSITYQYGLTDKITVGVFIPYYWKKTKVNEAFVETSTGTLGQNPAFGTTADPFGTPFIPITLGGLQNDAFATAFVQGFLQSDLGLEPIETWSESGIGDIEAGLRYQYYSSEKWRLAATGNIIFPTGEIDDPDNLIDRSFGNGAMGLQIDFNQDYTGIDKLTLNATVGLGFYFVDKLVRRVPDDVNKPITTNKAKVEKDVSDEYSLELSAGYSLSETLSISLMYRYLLGTGDDVSGKNPALDYSSLEDETDWNEQLYKIGLTYSTVSRYLEEKARVPMFVSIAYRDRFDGENITDSSYYSLSAGVFF